MDTMKRGALATEIVGAQEEFKKWRSARTKGSRIPEALWASAVRLAAKHGIFRVARALHLDYGVLKKRLSRQSDKHSLQASPPLFFELDMSRQASVAECTIEMENRSGSKMKIHVKGEGGVDVVRLSEAFLELGR